ncbi:hypothetical protein [Rubripirellula lacrimiformis]|uniref:hypothetical protein n=1 Tax=Rubripirellula lacrimiformis TaxID=1930273 RepID=UPI0011A1FF7A|nr:hypothetical protein [Rubripirellula lacrimiformis]
MKSVFTLLQALTAAFVMTCTFGCAPPAPVEVNTSTDVTESSNTTTGAEAPGSNTTTGADAPAVEEPAAEEPAAE